MPPAELRATRANRVFYTGEKRIRIENMAINESNNVVGFLYEIVDCVRMCFSSARNRRSARTAFRPRKRSQLCNNRTGAI
jgi:hypothetical protein